MLDWEESVFVGLRALYRRWIGRPRQKRRETARALLKDRRRELLLLAEMLAGRPLSLFETDDRRLASGDRVFLPGEFGVAETAEANAALYELKTTVAALALREGWSETPLPPKLKGLSEELPHLSEKIDRVRRDLPPGEDLWTLLGVATISDEAVGKPGALSSELANPESGEVTTEIEGRGQTEVTVLPTPEDDGPGHDLPMHTFEKVETAEEYDGQSRKSDTDDELADHAEALEELNMSQLVRSPERPRSLYRADLILDGLDLEVADRSPAAGHPYPEWDYRRRAYRPNWCFVRDVATPASDPAWIAEVETRRRALIRRLKRQFASIAAEWLRIKRQPSGGEFDIDAVVDAEVRRRARGAPSDAVYIDVRRDLHDVAALLLLDLSYSTDAWLDGVRVLDTIRDTIFCVGEVLDEFVEKFAVAGFSSNTRRSCHFHWLKNFHEPWPATRGRLGSIQPFGYTRIGAALRHAQELLDRQPARRKMILLVTDGRPCDYDRYEGNHGVHDVKKAIETGRRHGIAVHAFAIEKRAAEFFPRMFTGHHFDIISTPERLSRTVCRLFARLRTQ